MTNEAILREVFSDEEFAKSLFALETPQEVQTALQDRNIELSIDEIMNLRDRIVKAQEPGAELSDEELEWVSAGAHSDTEQALVDFIRAW